MALFLAILPALLLITLCYATVCAVSPFGRCRKCNGLGFTLITDRRGRPKRGKHCRRCDGHGIRIRAGRHLYHLATRIHHDGTRTRTITVAPTTRAAKENQPWS